VNATVENPVANVTGTLEATIGEDTYTANLTPGNATIFDLPEPLAVGTNATVTANADWPGRPETTTPDANLTATVPNVAPRLSVHPRLDAIAVPAPLPVHPAGPHTASFPHKAVDPNGDPVNVTPTLTGPTDPDWPTNSDPVPEVDVPENATRGKYDVTIEATDGNRSTTRTVGLEVAETVRLGLTAPDNVTVAENRNSRLNLTVHNLGSAPVDRAELFVDTDLGVDVTVQPDGAQADGGEIFALDLDPDESRSVPVELTPTGASASGPIEFTIAGVVE
jgi:hypothetical protein